MTLDEGMRPAPGPDAFDEEDQFEVPRSSRGRPPAAAAPAFAPARGGPPTAPAPSVLPVVQVGGFVPLPAEEENPGLTGSGTKELLSNKIGCVFMGPPQAGKTTLVGGILQSCMQPPTGPDDYRLKLITEGKSTSRVVQETYARMRLGRGQLDATESVNRYRFNVRVTRPGTLWRPPRHHEASLLVQDGPGGALFPDEIDIHGREQAPSRWETELLHQAKAAACLVLCVDATQRDTGVLLSQLPGRLRDLSESDLGSPTPVLATWRHRTYARLSRLWGEGSPDQSAVLERWLAARRVLILLTKIDALVEQAVSGPGEGLSAQALASAIDPVRQACEILGPVFLHQIYRALNPQNQRREGWDAGGLAVGVCSAWGFDPRSGRPYRSGADAALTDPTTRLNEWYPMGLRDAVIFMVCGHAGGTVQMVDEETLMEHAVAPRVRAGNHWFSRQPELSGHRKGWS